MAHPFTPTQLAALAIGEVRFRIATAAGYFMLYPSETDRDNETNGYPWYYPWNENTWNWWRLHIHTYGEFHPWRHYQVLCGTQAGLEEAGTLINSAHGTSWSWSGSLDAEANARALLSDLNDATEVEEA